MQILHFLNFAKHFGTWNMIEAGECEMEEDIYQINRIASTPYIYHISTHYIHKFHSEKACDSILAKCEIQTITQM